MSTAINLANLPTPQVVEPLDFEIILGALKADFSQRWPAFTADLESDPINKLLEVAAYRELIIRARINDAARAIMLPWAIGTNLDNLAARYDLARLPGEDDARFRSRVLIGYHALSAAGSAQSWMLRALSISVDVRQVDVWSDRPGRVKIAVLARVLEPAAQVPAADQAIGLALFGTPPKNQSVTPLCWRVANNTDPIINQIATALLADDVRPLTIDVDTTAARIKPIAVRATLIHAEAAKTAERIEAATRRVQALATATVFRVDLTRSQLIGALMVDGVRDVILAEPTTDTAATNGDLPVIGSIEIIAEVRRD